MNKSTGSYSDHRSERGWSVAHINKGVPVRRHSVRVRLLSLLAVGAALLLTAAGSPVAGASSSSKGGSSSSSGSSSTSSGSGSSTGSGGSSSGSNNSQGVSSNSISVGSIATLTGPIASDFNASTPGVQAYFDMVNAQGGINGRKLVLSHSLDDGGNPSQFSSLSRNLVNQYHVFAVVGVSTAFFNPGYFSSTGIPTYGYNVTGNWSGPPNLYAAGGSVQNYGPLGPYNAWLINKVHAKSVGIMAYNVSVSADACNAASKELKAAGIKVAYTDTSAPIDGNMAPDVQRMQQAGVDYILSCMDVTGNVSMARAIKQYGLKTTQLWLNGADQSVVNKYSNLMNGVYLNIQHVPLTAPTKYYPGLALYLNAMKKYSPSYVGDEVAIQGWQSASLFAAGVKAAGSNLTWGRVVQLTNQITNFTANGLATPTNWSTAHTPPAHPPYCSAFIKAQGNKFEPVYVTGHQVFACFGSTNAKDIKLVTPPAGTPGA